MEHLLKVRQEVIAGITSLDAVKEVLAGHPDLDLYRSYLKNVYYYASHSAAVIALAGSRCTISHPALSNYLMVHANEELGHELWALQDLEAIGVPADEVRASRPVPACAAMVGYEYFIAGHANPVGIFGWLYTLEAMGNDLGGRIAAAVGPLLGGRGGGIKFLEGHGVADRDHIQDLTNVISTIGDPQDQADINHVADVIGDVFVRMFQQIAAGSG